MKEVIEKEIIKNSDAEKKMKKERKEVWGNKVKAMTTKETKEKERVKTKMDDCKIKKAMIDRN